MTNLDDAADKYVNDVGGFSPVDLKINKLEKLAFKAGATFALNCEEVKAMREALAVIAKREKPLYAHTMKHGDQFDMAWACTALTAFDKLMEQVDGK